MFGVCFLGVIGEGKMIFAIYFDIITLYLFVLHSVSTSVRFRVQNDGTWKSKAYLVVESL